MRLSVREVLLVASLAWVAQAGLWSDIIKALKNTNRFVNLFEKLGDATTDVLNNEGDAALFICNVMHGQIPRAIDDLGADLGEVVRGEFESMTAFVASLPTLVPQVVDDIVRGGEDAVSLVEELVTNPGAARTVIENGVESVFSDVTSGVVSVIGDVTSVVGCDIGSHCPSSTSNAIQASCDAVLAQSPAAAASTTNVPGAATTAAGAAATTSALPGTGAAASSQAMQTSAMQTPGAQTPADQAPATPSPSSSGANISGPSYGSWAFVGVGIGFILLL